MEISSRKLFLIIGGSIVAAVLITFGVSYWFYNYQIEKLETEMSQQNQSLQQQIQSLQEKIDQQAQGEVREEETSITQAQKDLDKLVAQYQSHNSKRTSIDENWDLYENYGLGFSIKLPKRTEFGAVKILEVGQQVYFITDEYPSLENKLNEIELAIADPDIEQKHLPITWALTYQEINSEDDLLEFIQQFYGKNCGIGNKTALSDSNGYDVAIKVPQIQPYDPDCIINYMTYIKYNPEGKFLIHWDGGQDINFPLAGSDYADNAMAESFKFISKK